MCDYRKNPEIVFFDMALMRARQKQLTLVIFLHFYSDYFALGMAGWGWCIQMRLSAREVVPVK